MENKQISGRCFECQPVLLDNHDPPLAIYSSGAHINIISLKTGALINTYKKHTQGVSRILVSSIDDGKHILVSSSIDGYMSFWNVDTLIEMKYLEFGMQIHDFILPKGDNILKENIYIVVPAMPEHPSILSDKLVEGSKITSASKEIPEKENIKNDKYWLGIYNVSSKELTKPLMSLRFATHCIASLQLLNDEYIIGINKSSINFFTSNGDIRIKYKSDHIGSMNCMAINHEKKILVTGHIHGEIVLWHDLENWISNLKLNSQLNYHIIEGKKKPLSTILHWHAHPCSSLCFNPDGNFLYSGGEEGVLVQWNLLNNNSKLYLPRLGAHVAATSSASTEALIIVATTDNTLRIIDAARMKIDWTLQYLSITASALNPTKKEPVIFQSDSYYICKLAIEPSHNYLVTNGYPGHLQFYNMVKNTFETNLEIVPYTRVSRTEKYTRIYVPSVSFFQFSTIVNNFQKSKSYFLGTIDIRKGEEIGIEYSLKLWQFNKNQNLYVQVAQMDRPHGNNTRVCNLQLVENNNNNSSNSSKSMGCMTSAVDGSIKYWTTTNQPTNLVPNNDTATTVAAPSNTSAIEGEIQWVCLYTFKYRDCPVNAISFSSDNSVLSISYENVVTFWNPLSLALKTSIVSHTANNIIFTAFIEPILQINNEDNTTTRNNSSNKSAYLFIGSRRHISLYNLLTLECMWTVYGKFSTFAVAKNENEAIKSGKDLGWIACSMSPPHPTVTKYNIDEHEDSAGVLEVNTYLAVFTLFSAVPLMKIMTPSKVTSIAFTPSTYTTTSSEPLLYSPSVDNQGGLVYLTAMGDMFYYGYKHEDNQFVKNNADQLSILAKSSAITMPTLDRSYFDSSTTLEATTTGTNSIHVAAGLSSTWFHEYIDRESNNIPSMGAIYRDFMSSFVPTKQQNVSENSIDMDKNTAIVKSADQGQNNISSAQVVSHISEEKLKTLKTSTLSLFSKLSCVVGTGVVLGEGHDIVETAKMTTTTTTTAAATTKSKKRKESSQVLIQESDDKNTTDDETASQQQLRVSKRLIKK